LSFSSASIAAVSFVMTGCLELISRVFFGCIYEDI
jgi:hypothetical protein